MLDFTPDPIAFQIGPFPVYWYGIGYALGLAAVYLVLTRLAKLAGEDPEVAGNGMIIVAIAALIGGRLYHVIDQWHLYAADPLSIILPPYSGLGVYGGIITGVIAAYLYARRVGAPFARWADIVAPSLFVMQAIGRWGNFFNQELYGPPTTLPWGIAIDCEHRLEAYACAAFDESTRFHPLFLYESISGVLGAAFLIWLGFRARKSLRPGDLLLVFFVWYGITRLILENLREGNWLFYGVPVATIVSVGFIVVGVAGLIHRHRPRREPDAPPTHPAVATWGAMGSSDWRTRPIDEPWAHAGDLSGGRSDRPADELGIGSPEDDDAWDDDELDDEDAEDDEALDPGAVPTDEPDDDPPADDPNAADPAEDDDAPPAPEATTRA